MGYHLMTHQKIHATSMNSSTVKIDLTINQIIGVHYNSLKRNLILCNTSITESFAELD